jgi:CubicO group peptidase (beta-lactamase class C family)
VTGLSYGKESHTFHSAFRLTVMRKQMETFFRLVLFCTATSVFAQTGTPAQLRLDQRVPIWLKAFNVTGVGVAYIQDGKIAWTAFYGDQIPGGPKANNETLYSVASLTKPVTAELILRLASQEKLSLDEPVFRYWTDPDVRANPWNQLLTPQLCLSHQTGFSNWRYQTQNVLTFEWQPGTHTGYSGEGYDYVARFAERKTGQPFLGLTQHYVFEPIGMKDTSYIPEPGWAGRQAKPVESVLRTKWSAADLLRATVSDYAKFVISVMHNDAVTKEIAGRRLTITRNLISPDKEKVLCEASTHPDQCHVSAGFGLGWHVVNIDGRIIADHTGKDADVETFAFFIPEQQSGAVIFTNGPDVGHEMIDKILNVLYPDSIYAQTLW